MIRGFRELIVFKLFLGLCFIISCLPESAVADKSNEIVLANEKKSMEVRNIAVVDINGVLRSAAANGRIRELLDEQRLKFQGQFREVELDLQQKERDLVEKRKSLPKDKYQKLVAAFQQRVTNVQKEIQYKRQTIDNAYQKAQEELRKLAIEVIKEIAVERQIDMILKPDASVIFLPELNISDEVLARLDERTKNARIEVEVKKPLNE